jgi:hypothetical protein
MERVNIDKLPDTNELIDIIANIRIRLKSDEMKKLFEEDAFEHRQKIESEFEEFCDKYPTLFNKIYKNDDMRDLAQYLKMIDKIKSGRIEFNAGEALLADMMAEKYLTSEMYNKTKNM